MHTATLFNDPGAASGRGWNINHDDDCGWRVPKSPEGRAVYDAVLAIYDAVPWPYPEGIWPVGTFTAEQLRDHLTGYLATR